MQIKLNIPEYTINTETEYTSDVFGQNKRFPLLNIGTDSYIEEAIVDNVLDEDLCYCVQIGRYSSVAHDVRFIIDMNHDYKKVCQGRIKGVKYNRPELTRRKGQIIIMNDCWIGEQATIMSGVIIGNGAVVASGAVVSKDVPSYAIVAGNPARVIGYRFNQEQIEALNIIRWWNWSKSKIEACAENLYGDVDKFIEKYIDESKKKLMNISNLDLQYIEKHNKGEERIYLYIPDFEQDYPTYPKVIEGFAKSFSDTNAELLLYIKEDEFLEEKIAVLDDIFSNYADANCYINIYVGNVVEECSLFGRVDYYITNRSLDNVKYVDIADLFGIPIISSVDIPIFEEKCIYKMVKNTEISSQEQTSNKSISKLTEVVKSQNKFIEIIQSDLSNVFNKLSQLSVNQYAMNNSIDNLKYEIMEDNEKPKYPIVKSGDEAIDLIINEEKSMCRFGDGEFAVIAGENRQKFQRADERLGVRLKEVLASDDDNILVCIADTYGDLSKYNLDCKYNIRAYMTEEVRKQHYELLDFDKIYYDTYVTRPYASYIDNNTQAPKKRFQNLRRIWECRDVLIIEGEKTRMGVGNDLFDNANSIIRILGPAEHAFDRYDEILKEALKQEKEKLVLIAMGATATVLAYDLAKAGYQALDIGHIDMEYEWMLAGKGKKVEVKHKYNNEVAGGDKVEDVNDFVYESQIVARIY